MAKSNTTSLLSNDYLPFRDCAGVVLFNHRGEVFVGHRIGMTARYGNQPWQMPQGGIDRGEDPFDAAQRELREETNVSSTHLLAAAEDWVAYDFPPGAANKVHKGKYRGQRQMWFAMLFSGDDSEIDIKRPMDGTHKAEFSQWRWEPLENIAELVVPFKRDTYLQLVDWFADIPDKIRSGDIPGAQSLKTRTQ